MGIRTSSRWGFATTVWLLTIGPAIANGEVGDAAEYWGSDGSASCETGAACSNVDGCACLPRWVVTPDALFLQRRTPDSTVLMGNLFDPAQILNASDFDQGFHAGVDFSVARRLGDRNAIEVRYFGIDGWDAGTSTATTPGDPLLVNAAVPIIAWAGDSIDARYSSELHNFEINGYHELLPRLSLLTGFRYLELDENFAANLNDSPVPFVYDAATRNRAYGFQLGGQAVLWGCGEPFSIDFVGKAGIFGNCAAQASQYSTGLVTLPASGTDRSTAFVGELGVTAKYQFTQCLLVRGGYRLLWVDGMALATDQVAASEFVSGSGINATSDAFYHGAFVGREFAR